GPRRRAPVRPGRAAGGRDRPGAAGQRLALAGDAGPGRAAGLHLPAAVGRPQAGLAARRRAAAGHAGRCPGAVPGEALPLRRPAARGRAGALLARHLRARRGAGRLRPPGTGPQAHPAAEGRRADLRPPARCHRHRGPGGGRGRGLGGGAAGGGAARGRRRVGLALRRAAGPGRVGCGRVLGRAAYPLAVGARRVVPAGQLRRLPARRAAGGGDVVSGGAAPALTPDELLTTTRTVRRRLDLTRPVPLSLVAECLRIAQQAPCGSGRHTPHWIVVTDPATRATIGELYRDAFATGAPAAGADPARRRLLASAAHLAAHLGEVPVL